MNESEQRVREFARDGGEFDDLPALRELLRLLDEARAELTNLRVLVSPANEQAMRDLRADLARVTAERERYRGEYEQACLLVAKMHHAATGSVSGPRIGVVEDVAALAAKLARCEAVAAMLDAVVQGAQEEFVRVPYGASHEDVAQINDWHAAAKEARDYFAALKEPRT